MSKKQRLKVVEGSSAEAHKAFAGKSFTPHDLVSFTPKTYPQEQFFSAYYSNVPLIAQLGSAGTGKTVCAAYAALSDVVDKGTVYDKVVIVRSAVQTRDIGFTSGDADQKAEVYESPYIQIFDEIVKFKSNNYENLKAKSMVDFHLTSFLRGTTFDNSIIIIDEGQSLTYHELSTVLTRAGVNSRVIICADFKQDDLIKKKSDQSGLFDFMRVVENMDSSFVDTVVYRPEDVVRSGLAREFIIAAEKAGI